ncbi:MAG TPA: response regulator [Chitinophagaceae bacterium]|nr:response regulator [Chitinophagaceae bacterium]
MKRILVVDDNVDALAIIKTMLETRGYEVYILTDAAKVMESIKKFSPNLILLDVYLAGYNGIDICIDIKAKPNLKDIPLVLMSAHSNLDVMLQNCKADAFVAKPYDPNHLLAVIKAQLTKAG